MSSPRPASARLVRASARWAIALLCTPSLASAQNQICIKQVSSAPTIDGVVAVGLPSLSCVPDPVWAGVSPGAFQPESSLPYASLHLALRPSVNRLYAGVAVGGDEDLSDQDYVLFFFDAANDDTYGNGDLALRVRASAAATPIAAGRQCNQPTGGVEVFVHDGTNWILDPSLGAQVDAKLAYDYETSEDPDGKLWNLELAMPTNGAFALGGAAPFFAVGAFLFVDDGHEQLPQQGTVLAWPASITTAPGIAAIDPNFAAPAAAELANADSSGLCFDVNFSAPNPWRINGTASSSGDHNVVAGASNTFTVTFFYDGPGTGPSPQPNAGKVRLSLRPYGAIPSGAQVNWVKESSVTAATTNSAVSAVFTFDFGDFPPEWNGFGTTNLTFVCATMTLVDFQRNDDQTNDSHSVNYNYFQTSTYPQRVYISAHGIPGLGAGEETTILLRVDERNEGSGAALRKASAFALRAPRGLAEWTTLALAALALVLGARAARRARPRRTLAALWIVLALGLTLAACHVGGGDGRSAARWSFENGDELGIRPVPGRQDWYSMPIREGDFVGLDLRFEGRPLPYQAERARLDPRESGGAGAMHRRPVKPGQVLAFVATGTIDPDGDGPLSACNANGQRDPEQREGYLLRPGYYEPRDHAGALVGSFDGFETSFVVGGDAAFVVPEGASTLAVALNLTKAQLAQAVGLLDLWIIEHPPIRVPSAQRVRGDGTLNTPYFVDSSDVLTSLSLFTYYSSVELDAAGRRVSETFRPLGFAHQSVYDSHAR